MEIERNQVWKFQGRLWRVEKIEEQKVQLVGLLDEHTMEALSVWVLFSPEWELIYEHS